MVTVTSCGTVGHQDSMSMILDLPSLLAAAADTYTPSKINIEIEMSKHII